MAQTLTEHRHLQLPIPTSLAGRIHLVWGGRSPKAAGGDDIHPLSFWKGTPKGAQGTRGSSGRCTALAGPPAPTSPPQAPEVYLLLAAINKREKGRQTSISAACC